MANLKRFNKFFFSGTLVFYATLLLLLLQLKTTSIYLQFATALMAILTIYLMGQANKELKIRIKQKKYNQNKRF